MIVMKIKKQKAQRSGSYIKLRFEDYKHCLEATHLKNKKHLEKNSLIVDNL